MQLLCLGIKEFQRLLVIISQKRNPVAFPSLHRKSKACDIHHNTKKPSTCLLPL
jgi:hypothetical protein